MEGASNGGNVNINIDNELPTKKMDSLKPKSSNKLDPTDKNGKDSNVFDIRINFPPSKSEKKEINKVNSVDSLLKEGYAIAALKPKETCDTHGYEYSHKINVGKHKISYPPLHDSRTSKVTLWI